MTPVEIKKITIKSNIKAKGFTLAEVARRLGKSPQNFLGGLSRLKTMNKLEELEKKINEVI